MNSSEQELDFSGIEFASRSFMVQLYSMLAKQRSQVRFLNINETVERMYQLVRISLRGDRFALSSQINLIVFIILLINSEMYEKFLLS